MKEKVQGKKGTGAVKKKKARRVQARVQARAQAHAQACAPERREKTLP
jgi:hypothetical protein